MRKILVALLFLTSSAIAQQQGLNLDSTNTGVVGTLNPARLPFPAAGTIGGVKSVTCSTHQWLNIIDTSGAPACAQPAITDISGIGTIATKSYSSGPWTPTLIGSVSGSWVLSVAVGSYEQIDRQITVRFVVIASSASSPSGNIQIGGLPFTSTATTNDHGDCFISYQAGLTNSASFTTFSGLVLESVTVVSVYENGSGQASQTATVGKASTTPTLIGFCSYHT